jgi:hypothetical protein
MGKDREEFYSRSAPPPEDDDAELELEAPDPEVEERRRRDAAIGRVSTIDINEVYTEAERKRSTEIVEGWLGKFDKFDLKKFQFQVKHLLILTAVVAVFLSMSWTMLIVLTMISIIGVSIYLSMQDKKQQAEADKKRQEMYAARRAKFGPQNTPNSGHVVGGPVTPVEPLAPLPSREDEIWEQEAAKEKFKFQFSLKQTLVTMTIAAVVLGLGRVIGGPEIAATLLGLVALSGLVAYAAGYEPPQIVAFGWWITLILYIVVSMFAAVWGRVA